MTRELKTLLAQEREISTKHVISVEDGNYMEDWGQGDALGLMQQLGKDKE